MNWWLNKYSKCRCFNGIKKRMHIKAKQKLKRTAQKKAIISNEKYWDKNHRSTAIIILNIYEIITGSSKAYPTRKSMFGYLTTWIYLISLDENKLISFQQCFEFYENKIQNYSSHSNLFVSRHFKNPWFFFFGFTKTICSAWNHWLCHYFFILFF